MNDTPSAATESISDQLLFWEQELAAAALNNDDARAKLCEQRVQEFTALIELTLGTQPGRPGLIDEA
jgi:hypothetical protein